MKKLVAVLVILVLAGFGIWYWQKDKQAPAPVSKTPEVKSVTLINPDGPVVIPVTGLAGKKVDTKGINVKVQYWKNNDEPIGLLASKKADFAVLPVVMGANVASKGIDLVMLGVHEWKVFYMIAPPGVDYKGWTSLKGQQVYIPVGKGSTVDLLLRSAIKSQGMVPDQDVKLVYSPPQEIVALFKTGKVQYAALPEPFVTLATKGGQGKIVADFQKYWGEVSGGPDRIPVAGLFVRRDFLNKHPKETEKIASAFAASTAWSTNNVDEALSLTGKVLPIPAPVMKQSLTRLEFKYVKTSDCRAEVQKYLKKIHEMYPEGLKTLPGEGFYKQ
ncbi:MAG: ABC transporter substrate-binding protein [Chitinophagales bacterium]